MSATDTPVTLSNRALSELATRSTITAIDGTDPSYEALQAQLWYNTCRLQLLRTAHWGFARTQLSLTQTGDLYPDNTSPYPWGYQYVYPSDCVKMRYIIAPPIIPPGNISPPNVSDVSLNTWWWRPSRKNRFVIQDVVDANGKGSKQLVSNVYAAIGVYTRDEQNPALYDELFIQALTTYMAYRMAPSINGNIQIRAEMKQATQEAIIQARTQDGNEAIPTTDHVPDWIATRGIGSPFGYGTGPNPWDAYASAPAWGNWYSGWDDLPWGE